ncbi:hypothetical protein BGZ82_007577 [Podila clonocystis]|nr:hypothetical protein BGZ82_007577 [Podila clonocystis]
MASFSPVTQVDPSTLVVSAAAASAAEEKVTEDQFNSLHASSVTYRDLLIFEERLKLNMFRLKKRQQKYEAFLGTLILIIAYCAFGTFYQPSQTYIYYTLHKFFLLVSCTTMFLFFATGMYSEKLGYSSKFVPQCNRVLRIYNMHFNRDNRPELSFFRKVPKKFQEGFTAYKASYFKRKSEKRAAALAAAKAGNSPGSSTGRSGQQLSSQHQRRLQPSSRGRRMAGNVSGSDRGGGPGSASGSDSGSAWPRSSLGRNSMSISGSERPLLRPHSTYTSSSTTSTATTMSRQPSNAGSQ